MSETKSHQKPLTNRNGQRKPSRENQVRKISTALNTADSLHTQNNKAQKISEDRIKETYRRTLEVLEADRKTISKELHDSIGANLAAIKFSLEEKEMTRLHNNGRLDESLDQEIGYLMETIKETKRISANLRPSTLDDLGLLATIDWYIRQFKKLYGDIQIEYRNEFVEHDIPEPLKIIIYRIIQEGLSNAEKHSDASVVRLTLKPKADNKAILLMIKDNGRGFDVNSVFSDKDPLSGYGLTAMLERCEICGGNFQITSERDVGTTLVAQLPIR